MPFRGYVMCYGCFLRTEPVRFGSTDGEFQSIFGYQRVRLGLIIFS